MSTPIYRFVVPENTRNPAQHEQYVEINRKGICPFCSLERFEEFHRGEIIHLREHWILTTNDTPYKGTRVHALLVFRSRHICNIRDLKPEEWLDLLEVLKFSEIYFQINSGAFLMRFGEPGHNGSSVEHLHAHIIVGAGTISDIAERIRVKVGYHEE
jgi:ATP adenylyltransferase